MDEYIHVNSKEKMGLRMYYAEQLTSYFEEKVSNENTRMDEFYILFKQLLKPFKNEEEMMICDYDNKRLVIIVRYGQQRVDCYITEKEHLKMNDKGVRRAFRDALQTKETGIFCYASPSLMKSISLKDMDKLIDIAKPTRENFYMYILFKNVKVLLIHKVILGYRRLMLYREDDAAEVLKDFDGKKLDSHYFN